MLRRQKWVILATAAAVLLAIGWVLREQAFAAQKAKFLESKTVSLGDVKLKEFVFEEKPRGEIAVYFEGETPGTKNFVVGQFRLKPGQEPHPIHKHPEEEVLIVASGKGEIHCDGKTTPVAAGSIMYTGPNAPHSIKNTGDEVLVFYWVKWTGVSR